MGSPQSYTDGQWSPPPRFQEHDQIYAAEASPQAYSPGQNSPPALSPPLQDYQHQDYHHSQISSQNHEGYQEGYFNSPWVFHPRDPLRAQSECSLLSVGLGSDIMTDIRLRKKHLTLHIMHLEHQPRIIQGHRSCQGNLLIIPMVVDQCHPRRMGALHLCLRNCGHTDSKSSLTRMIPSRDLEPCLLRFHRKTTESAV